MNEEQFNALAQNLAMSAMYFVYSLDRGHPQAVKILEVLFSDVDAIRQFALDNDSTGELAEMIGDYMESRGIEA